MAREEGFFDELARGLADGTLTRGKALRLMGAAVVGGTLGSFGIGGVALADDQCKPTAKKCKKDKQCCSGNCEGGTCAACPSGYVLLGNGTCAKSCTSNSECSASADCGCYAFASGNYCSGEGGSGTLCTSDSQCPRGEACSGVACVPLCS